MVGGVYFYFGYSRSNPDKICVYIGKASFNSTTGRRLWSHFRYAFDENGQIVKTSSNGDPYNIEAITLIPFEIKGMTCFVSALEEHLITEFDKEGKYEILNVTGRK